LSSPVSNGKYEVELIEKVEIDEIKQPNHITMSNFDDVQQVIVPEAAHLA